MSCIKIAYLGGTPVDVCVEIGTFPVGATAPGDMFVVKAADGTCKLIPGPAPDINVTFGTETGPCPDPLPTAPANPPTVDAVQDTYVEKWDDCRIHWTWNGATWDLNWVEESAPASCCAYLIDNAGNDLDESNPPTTPSSTPTGVTHVVGDTITEHWDNGTAYYTFDGTNWVYKFMDTHVDGGSTTTVTNNATTGVTTIDDGTNSVDFCPESIRLIKDEDNRETAKAACQELTTHRTIHVTGSLHTNSVGSDDLMVSHADSHQGAINNVTTNHRIMVLGSQNATATADMSSIISSRDSVSSSQRSSILGGNANTQAAGSNHTTLGSSGTAINAGFRNSIQASNAATIDDGNQNVIDSTNSATITGSSHYNAIRQSNGTTVADINGATGGHNLVQQVTNTARITGAGTGQSSIIATVGDAQIKSGKRNRIQQSTQETSIDGGNNNTITNSDLSYIQEADYSVIIAAEGSTIDGANSSVARLNGIYSSGNASTPSSILSGRNCVIIASTGATIDVDNGDADNDAGSIIAGGEEQLIQDAQNAVLLGGAGLRSINTSSITIGQYNAERGQGISAAFVATAVEEHNPVMQSGNGDAANRSNSYEWTHNGIHRFNAGTRNLTADPVATGSYTPVAGDMYYNSATNNLRLFNGTAWINL